MSSWDYWEDEERLQQDYAKQEANRAVAILTEEPTDNVSDGAYKIVDEMDIAELGEVRHYYPYTGQPENGFFMNGDGKIDRTRVRRFCMDRLHIYAFPTFGGVHVYDSNTGIYYPMDQIDLDRVLYGLLGDGITQTVLNDITRNIRAMAQFDVPDRSMLDKEQKPKTWIDIFPDGWDQDGNNVWFRNGIYNIDADSFFGHDPYLVSTIALECEYDPSIREHQVEDIYKGIIPDADTRALFFEAVGYTMFSQRLSPPSIFYLYGPGGTGKSALLNALNTALGDRNVAHMQINSLTGNFALHNLRNKLANIISETPTATKPETAEVLRLLSDGTPLTVDVKNKEHITFPNTAKMWYAGNGMANFGEGNSALERRLKIIPCRVVQDWGKQIYSDMVEPDAISWLVNRALRGYRAFLQRGRKFIDSEVIRQELKAYKAVYDPLSAFLVSEYNTTGYKELRECLDGVFLKDIMSSYLVYCKESGIGKPMDGRQFAERIRNEFSMKTITTRYYGDDGKRNGNAVAQFTKEDNYV